jgi:hypothetical protein
VVDSTTTATNASPHDLSTRAAHRGLPPPPTWVTGGLGEGKLEVTQSELVPPTRTPFFVVVFFCFFIFLCSFFILFQQWFPDSCSPLSTYHDGKGINKQNYPGTSSVLVRTHIHLLLNTAHTALLD